MYIDLATRVADRDKLDAELGDPDAAERVAQARREAASSAGFKVVGA